MCVFERESEEEASRDNTSLAVQTYLSLSSTLFEKVEEHVLSVFGEN